MRTSFTSSCPMVPSSWAAHPSSCTVVPSGQWPLRLLLPPGRGVPKASKRLRPACNRCCHGTSAPFHKSSDPLKVD